MGLAENSLNVFEVRSEKGQGTPDKTTSSVSTQTVDQGARTEGEETAKTATKLTQKGHIMLSYSRKAEPSYTMEVKNRLIAQGHQVWIDTEHISQGGSTLEAMAYGVDNASAVLIFYGSDYKNSFACRTEAEYAFERRKLIIPVQVEHGYQPDGWLGMIIGTKFRYYLAKYYERDMGDLISRANQIKSAESEESQMNNSAESQPSASKHEKTNKPTLQRQTDIDTDPAVKSWIIENNLEYFTDRFEGLDMELLSLLRDILRASPTQFYDLITRPDMVQLLRLHHKLLRLTTTPNTH